MNRPVRTASDTDEARARILEVAEERFRRVGYHRTSVADIAAELGMSPANVYRFFPSRDAINESICRRLVNEIAELAFAIARTSEPATERLDQLLTAIHRHNKMMLVKERYMHDLIATAMRENWAIAKVHIERMVAIVEAIIREGIESGEFQVEDTAQAARAVRFAFMPFFHPILIEHCVKQREDMETDMRSQIRFILKALSTSDQPVCHIRA